MPARRITEWLSVGSRIFALLGEDLLRRPLIIEDLIRNRIDSR
jgi:hypothetical protein